MRGQRAGSGRPRWVERHPWVLAAWSNRLIHAAVAGIVLGLIAWLAALGADAGSGKAAATGTVVGLLLAVNYGFLGWATRRNPSFQADHPWASAMTFVVPFAILLATLHYARSEASLGRTLLSAAVLVVVGGVAWRFLNPQR